MAVTGKRVTCDTGPTLIAEAPINGHIDLRIKNRSSASIFLGSSDASSSEGYELTTDDSIPLTLNPSESLFGMSSTGGAALHVLETRDA